MNITIIQTCDGALYKPLLDAAEPVNRAYASQHGYGYLRWDGIKHGSEPWQATFNRIYLIRELIRSDPQCEWVFYIDADAVVFDFERRLEEFLDPAYLLIACAGGRRPDNYWDLNAGVFFYNSRHVRAMAVLDIWAGAYESSKPNVLFKSSDSFVNSSEYAVSDQELLQDLLRVNPGLAKIYQGSERAAFNYGGTFIRQLLRQGNVSFEQRLAQLRALCAESITRNQPGSAASIPAAIQPTTGPIYRESSQVVSAA
jgi:hypothetical protein